VNWEPAPIESALKSRVAVAIAAYENGDKNAIKEYYRQSATVETKSAIYSVLGKYHVLKIVEVE
jgi:hypothetical protein